METQVKAVSPTPYPEILSLNIVADNSNQGIEFLKKVIKIFDHSLASREDNPQVWNRLGEALESQGISDKAETAFRQAIALNSNLSEAWSNLAQTQISLKHPQEAVESCHQALKLNPSLPSAYQHLALGLLHQQKLSEAEAACNQALTLKADYPEALATLAIIRTLQKRLDEAEALFDRVLTAQPTLVETYGNRAQVRLQQNRLDEALADVTQAETLKPWLGGIYAIKASILHTKQDHQGAEQAKKCFQALKTNPWSAQTHKELGNVLATQGKFDQAIAMYQRALAIQPNFAEAYNNWGSTLVSQKKEKEAIAYYQKAVTLKPELLQSHLNLGNLFKDYGQWEEAIASFQKVLAIEANHLEAHKGICYVLLRQGKLDETIKACRQTLAIDPDCQQAELSLGAAYQSKGQYDKARQILQGIAFKKYGLTPEQAQRFNPISISDAEEQTAMPTATPFRMRDCIDQLQYLLAQGKIDSSFEELLKRYQLLKIEVEAKSQNDPTAKIVLEREQLNALGGYYNKIIHYKDASPLSVPTLNDSLDYKAIEERYLASSMVYFDDFLSPEALQGLRQFCLESTIFFKHRASGYVGAYLDDGLSNSLLYQIADELKQRLPRVLGALPVGNMWVYRYQNRGNGIQPHTGDGSVTLNFWFTPDEANLGPKDGGGLVIWDKDQSPLSTSKWLKFNAKKDDPKVQEEISEFLRSATSQTIPYRCNRAVLFHSTLWHRSHPFHFRDSFEHRRMNGVMLFGIRSIPGLLAGEPS
ncbi:MAG: tetratricopeptide repeat protein [Cyanobacteria bacterium P01_G01_bin.49]